ncbi:MAG: glycosyltransferase family 2 protein [Victivallaceae bacterium]|nr:glycosyltransferase family 2 protein [Victivallaceae bacterium]
MSSSIAFLREKYLRRNNAAAIPGLEKFSRAVVIPAWDELDNLPATLDALNCAEKVFPVATLVVVNHPQGSDPAPSEKTVEYLQKRQKEDQTLFIIPAFEIDGGVGAARKRGMDAFLASRTPDDDTDWIFSLDADTQVSSDYFLRIEHAIAQQSGVSAWTLPYLHRVEDPSQENAVRRYEAYLARYVAKLAAAGSPYAISTVGSAFCVRLGNYLKANGMKVRQAGEDFYFLCELVKTGKVRALKGDAVVFPSGRISGRTPFGTGKAVADLLAGGSLNEIPDHAFDELALVLTAAKSPLLREAPQTWTASLPSSAQAFFDAERFLSLWEKVLQNTPCDDNAVQKAFHRWFDGLKTLRYLHFAKSMRGSAAI